MTRSVRKVLKELGLQHHEKSFKENSIDSLDDLVLLSNQDLRDLGVTKIGERNRLMAWIKQQQEEDVPPSPRSNGDEDSSRPLSTRSSTNPFDDEEPVAQPASVQSNRSTNPFDDEEEEEEEVRPLSVQSTHSTNPFDSDDDNVVDDKQIKLDTAAEPTVEGDIHHKRKPTKDEEELAMMLEAVNEENQKKVTKLTPTKPPRPTLKKDKIPAQPIEEGEEEDLASALEAMDIDQDFACWTSFRSSISSRNLSIASSPSVADKKTEAPIQEEEEEDAPLTKADEQDLKHWKSRLEREELYSHRYRPDQREQQELDDLATFLGIGKQKSSSSVSKQKKKTPESPNTNKKQQDDHNSVLARLFAKDEPPFSVLLKRGPVLFRRESNSNADFEERELILLTHGFILARVNENTKSPLSGFMRWIQRSYDQCHLYTNVKCLEDTPSNNGFVLHLVDGKVLKFQCATEIHQLAWLQGLERVVIETYTRFSAGNPVRSEDEDDLGWQHELIQTSLFSVAVTGDVELLREKLGTTTSNPATLNRLDKYHEFSALHYATHHHHLESMRVLLEAGADPNIENGVKDIDDMFQSPMYFATRDEWQDGIELLTEFGAKPSRRARLEQSEGELFVNARVMEQQAATTTRGYHKNDRMQQTHNRARDAQGTMAENMRDLQLRGQKIEELGTKANKLHSEAASYADYAKQLKEKTKKQSRWGF